MGRYYNGEGIEGKFWVGVQDSDDASFFGGEVVEPQILKYHFDMNDLESIKEGIKKCNAELGENKEKIDQFFEEKATYNDIELGEYLEVENSSSLLEWYARLELGEKILKCVKEQDYCDFEAEL